MPITGWDDAVRLAFTGSALRVREVSSVEEAECDINVYDASRFLSINTVSGEYAINIFVEAGDVECGIDCSDMYAYERSIVKAGDCYAVRVMNISETEDYYDCNTASVSFYQLDLLHRLSGGRYSVAVSGVGGSVVPDNVELREDYSTPPLFATQQGGGYELREDGSYELRE
jgi:hypothetical protein